MGESVCSRKMPLYVIKKGLAKDLLGATLDPKGENNNWKWILVVSNEDRTVNIYWMQYI